MLLRELDAQPVHDVPQAPADADAKAVLFAARDLAGGLAELGARRIERPGLFQQTAAVLGQRDAVPVTDEQREAEFFLELMNMAAERGLRDVEAFGGPGDTQGVSHGNEGLYVPKVHGGGILYQIRMA